MAEYANIAYSLYVCHGMSELKVQDVQLLLEANWKLK